MIKNLKDLQDYKALDVRKFIEKFGDDEMFIRSFLITSPGCSDEEIAQIKQALPGIPESYLKIAKAVNLNGVAVGYFSVSPASFNPEGLLPNLLEANDEEYLCGDYAKKYKSYLVGCQDEWGVAVATAESPFQEGEIIAIDEEIYADPDDPERWIFPIAQDFEQFLILAGNLNQLGREIKDDNSNREVKKQEFAERLKILNVPEKYHAIWLQELY